MIYKLNREEEGGLLTLKMIIDNTLPLKMILDTGACHTTIDSNFLYILGYHLKDKQGTMPIETANGIVEADLFEIRKLSGLGIQYENFQVQAFDFIAHGIISDYNGLLGLDFLEGTKFCIDLVKEQIFVQKFS